MKTKRVRVEQSPAETKHDESYAQIMGSPPADFWWLQASDTGSLEQPSPLVEVPSTMSDGTSEYSHLAPD